MTPPASLRARGIAATASVTVAVLALAGCGLLGGSDRGGSEMEYDEESGRYFHPELVTQSTALIDEHFPQITEVQDLTISEGQFTDPDERVVIPAPDDYWWQAVIGLKAEEIDSLWRAGRAAQKSDGGTGSAPEVMSDEELFAIIVPALEAVIPSCPSGWIPVGRVLAESEITEAGDMLEAAVLCEGGSHLIIAAHDM